MNSPILRKFKSVAEPVEAHPPTFLSNVDKRESTF